MSQAIIFKHRLDDNVVSLKLAGDATVLSVQEQGSVLQLWEQHSVDAENKIVERVFVIVGTGHIFDPCGLTYVTSVLLNSGVFVWHVYERDVPR